LGFRRWDWRRGVLRSSTLVSVLLGGSSISILYFGYQVNQKSFSDDGFTLAGTILVCVILPVASSVWSIRRSVQRDIFVRLAAILEKE
jgi:peptidoglycan/LPS O-acetylase OafA/YrhL